MMTSQYSTVDKTKILKALLNPQSVMVVGASNQPHKAGGRPIHYLKKYGYAGKIYPVNPAYLEVQGLQSFASIDLVPEPVDVAVISLPADRVLRAVEDCGQLGIRAAVIYSSGFAEIGKAGAAQQQQLMSIAQRYGMRVLGPNAQGPASFSTGSVLNFSTVFNESTPKVGPIAIISQSGGAAAMAYGMARNDGLGVSYCIATGNDGDLTVADMVDAVRDQGDARVALLYFESVSDADGLARAAEAAIESGMHIIALKSGRSAAGSAAAASHTGALMTGDKLFSAYLKKLGVFRVDTLRQAVEALPLYLASKRTCQRSAAFVSHSGAMGVMAADSAEHHGLSLASLEPETISSLKALLPSFGTPINPIDLTAAAMTQPGMFEAALAVVSKQSNLGAVIVGVPVAGAGYNLPVMAKCVADIDRAVQALVVAALPQPEVRELFKEKGVICFQDEDTAIRCVSSYFHHLDVEQARRAYPHVQHHSVAVHGGGRCLSEHDSLKWISAGGFRVARHEAVYSEEDAVQAWKRLAGPVAVKGNSPLAPHKSEMGLVQLGLNDEATVRQCALRMLEILRNLGEDKPEVTVAEMVSGRLEIVIGAQRHPVLGVFIMIGAGGKYIEELDDIVTLSAPFSEADALDALRQLRIYPLIQGARGEAALDDAGIARMAKTLAEHMARPECANVTSVDVNPIVMRDRHIGSVAVDALVTVAWASNQL